MSDLYVPKGYTMVYDDGEASTYFPTYSKATPADLIAAVRRGVESGTIEGTVEVVGEPGYGAGVDYVAPGTYLVIPVDGEENG